jgi:hypothetical protein
MAQAATVVDLQNDFDGPISDIAHMARIVSLTIVEMLDGITEGRVYGEDDFERAKFTAFHLEDMTKQLQRDWRAEPAVGRVA